MRLKRYPQALSDFDKAIEVFVKTKDLADAYNGRGTAHSFLKEYRQALHDFDYAIDLCPDNRQFYQNRANMHFSLGNLVEGLKDTYRFFFGIGSRKKKRAD
jgi:tetratricopeptide (TPR) repeat protein